MSCFYNFRDRSNKSTRWLCFQKKASSFQIHKSIYMHSHACLQLGKGCKFAIWISHSTQHIWKVCAMHGALFAYHKRTQWIYRLVENIFELKHIMMGPLTQKIEKPKINKKLVYTTLKCILIALHLFSYILWSSLLWIIWERQLQAIIFLEAYK